MAGVLAQLKVVIGADIAKLKSGLDEAAVRSELTGKKMSRSFTNLGRTFARAIGPLSATGRQVSFALQGIGESAEVAATGMKAFGAATAIVGGIATGGLLALTGLTVKLFQQIDEQSDLAKGVGLTTAEYVKLTSALKLYGVEQQQITPGLSQFFKIVSGLMRSKAGAEAIDQLGLSMQKLRLMTTHEQLLAISDAFSKFPDGPRKSAIAAQLFTATLGAKMIPLLDQGAKGVEKLESKYTSLGEASGKMADASKNLSIAWSGAVSSVEAFVLKASSWAHIPQLLENIAHPLLTLKEFALGLGIAFTWTFEEINKGALAFVRTLNSVGRNLHLPAISTSGLAANISQLQNIREQGLNRLAETLKAIQASGETPLKGGGNLAGGGTLGGGPNKVVAFLASLKQQIAEFGKGDTAKGIDKLKELGATQKQLAEGKGLLAQLQYLKEEEAFTKGFEKAQASFAKVLEKLKIPRETLAGWNKLGETLDGIVDSMRQAGASALGFSGKTFSAGLQAQAAAAAGAGGPIGGLTPGFTPSGFGKMRFDMDKLNVSAKGFGQTMSESFTRMIETGQGFRQMLMSITRELETMAIKSALFGSLGKMLGGKGGFLGVIGNFFSGLSAPGRAMGGPVSAGSLYRVGEHGPEYFAPGISGSIIPPANLHGGAKQSIVYAPTFHVNTPDADSFRKSQGQIITEGYGHMLRTHARNR